MKIDASDKAALSIIFYENTGPKDINGCMPWLKTISQGYGVLNFRGSLLGAHRAAYLLKHGEIPNKMHVCHSCDNKICVNVDHLWVGSPRENQKDRYLKGSSISSPKEDESILWHMIHKKGDGSICKKEIIDLFKRDQDELRTKIITLLSENNYLYIKHKRYAKDHTFTRFVIRNFCIDFDEYLEMKKYAKDLEGSK